MPELDPPPRPAPSLPDLTEFSRKRRDALRGVLRPGVWCHARPHVASHTEAALHPGSDMLEHALWVVLPAICEAARRTEASPHGSPHRPAPQRHKNVIMTREPSLGARASVLSSH